MALESVNLMFDTILDGLPKRPNEPIWAPQDGDEILCDSHELAISLADLLDSVCGEPVAHVGYYDAVEDQRQGELDERSGWWYLSIQ